MARKSRKNIPEAVPVHNDLFINTALYIRLSVEDGKKRSNSIENQQLIIDDYISDKPEFKVYDTYIDNGLTGATFDRPSFQRMLSDIEAGYINCVIVKDLCGAICSTLQLSSCGYSTAFSLYRKRPKTSCL